MRFIYLLFLFALAPSVYSQKIDVRINKSVHDFGYIKEVEGPVDAEFEFKNHSPFPISVFKVISSCGCAVASADDGWIKPNETGKIKVSYDPTGRPGKFVKSFEIQFITDSLKKSAFINIKGYTIEKEIIDVYTENMYEGARLFIKPFHAEIFSGSDYRFLQDEKLQSFVNDITYEIDQNGFANVQLEIKLSNKDSSCRLSSEIFPVVHKFIISELQRRKYQPWQVGFTDKKCLFNDNKQEMPGGELKITSRDFNNDTIQESGFFYSGKTIDPSRFQISPEKDSIDYFRRVITAFHFKKEKELSLKKNEHYLKFIQLAVRKQLMERKAAAGIRIEVKLHPETSELLSQKLITQSASVYDRIKTDIDDEGGNKNAVLLALPELIITHDSTLKKGKYYDLKYVLLLFHSRKDSSSGSFHQFVLEADNHNIRLNDFIEKSGFSAPYQNLPVLEVNHLGIYIPDSTNRFIKSWCSIIKKEVENGKRIGFIIESSVANSPGLKKKEGEQKANLNAKTIRDLLIALLQQNSSAGSLYDFQIVSTLVRGAESTSKNFNLQFNDPFNLLKIIPVYLTETNLSKTEKLIPYFGCFSSDSIRFSPGSMSFQNFISRLIPSIDKEGYVTLITEGGFLQKKVKPVNNSDEIISLFSNDIVKNIKREVKLRGYDDSRIIIKEQRVITYSGNTENKDAGQTGTENCDIYIKIIPELLIKN